PMIGNARPAADARSMNFRRETVPVNKSSKSSFIILSVCNSTVESLFLNQPRSGAMFIGPESLKKRPSSRGAKCFLSPINGPDVDLRRVDYKHFAPTALDTRITTEGSLKMNHGLATSLASLASETRCRSFSTRRQRSP